MSKRWRLVVLKVPGLEIGSLEEQLLSNQENRRVMIVEGGMRGTVTS